MHQFTKIIFSWIAVGSILCFIGLTANPTYSADKASQQDIVEASVQISALAEDTLALMQQSNDLQEIYIQNVEHILNKYFDVEIIAKLLLGRYRRKVTKEQLHRFNKVVHQYMVHAYGQRLHEFQASGLTVTSVTAGARKTITANLLLQRKEAKPIHLTLRLRKTKKSNQWKVFDLAIAGLSMIITQRDDFTNFIKQNKNNIDALITRLEEQVTATSNP